MTGTEPKSNGVSHGRGGPGRLRAALAATGYGPVLRHRDLRLLLGGLVVSATGSWAYNVALLAYAYERTHSLGWVAGAALARFVPALVFGPYAGVIAERFERIGLMVASDVVCMVLQLLLALAAALSGPVELVVALAALTAVANGVYFPAVAATIPELAGEQDLAAANALNATIDNLVVVVGPAVGAALVVLGSPAFAFAANAATFGASALLVMRIRTRSRPTDVTESGRAGPLRQMATGARAMVASSRVGLLVAFCALASLVYGTDTVLFVSVSKDQLGTGADGFGYLMAGLGVGGVAAAAAVNSVAASQRLAAIIVAGMAAYCLPTALLTAVHAPELAFALQVVRGAGTLFVDVLAITALQRALAPDLLARVFGAFDSVTIGAMAVGSLVAAPLISGLGLHGALLVMGFAFPALAVLSYPALARADRRAALRLSELAPRIAALEALRIFAAAPRPALERLAEASTEVDVAAGTAVVREGEPADALYALVDGEVEVTARGREGPVAVLGAGAVFGEIGLIEGIPRTATVTAREPTRLYRIEGDAFLDALSAHTAAPAFLEDAHTRLATMRAGRARARPPSEVPVPTE